MKYLLFIVMSMFTHLALAEASISTEAGQSNDVSSSISIKRDSSLSLDKSAGKRKSKSKSSEAASERSDTKSHAEKISNSKDRSESYTTDVNINGLLLREFVERYETNYGGSGEAGEYFNDCKAIINVKINFPVIYFGMDVRNGEIMGANEALIRLSNAHRKSRYNSEIPSYLHDGGKTTVELFDPNSKYVSRYVQCLFTTSFWVAEAGRQASELKVSTEAEVQDKVRAVFAEMDLDKDLFTKLRQKSRNLWPRVRCSNFLMAFQNFQEPEMRCGVFEINGDSIKVNMRETLSESSIDGRSYKISLNTSNNDSVAVDDSISKDERVSDSDRVSTSAETFMEAKKSAGMNTSKSMDRSKSRKSNRGSGNSLSAAPK